MCQSVPFEFGNGVILHLQCHVIHNPIYDVLFGKPFDILAALATKTHRNGTMSVTITDQNMHAMVTLPARIKGKPHFQWSEPISSHNLMNQLSAKAGGFRR
jgi:hypothetical protein